MFICHQARSDGAINAGKSPDGVLANLTYDKQVKVPVGGPVLEGGWKVRILAKLDAADGLDVSDGVYQVAITQDNGVEKQLSASDLGITVDHPAGTIASVWHELGSGWTVPQGERYRIGSHSMNTPTVISIEDDS